MVPVAFVKFRYAIVEEPLRERLVPVALVKFREAMVAEARLVLRLIVGLTPPVERIFPAPETDCTKPKELEAKTVQVVPFDMRKLPEVVARLFTSLILPGKLKAIFWLEVEILKPPA